MVGAVGACEAECNEFLKAYRLHNEAWGLPGEKKYISAYDAIAYATMNIQKVEEVITRREGENVLSSGDDAMM